MAQYISCENKDVTAEDLLRACIATLFEDAGNEDPFGNALRLVYVQDSGEPYFCGQPFEGIDALARKLVGVDGNTRPAIRVAIGSGGANLLTCGTTHDTKSALLSIVGKGEDGEPLIRLAIANLPE